MAKVRVIDVWLRSPSSSVFSSRTVMVVAERWAEQRVLMRAYTNCRDQTQPMITLSGYELAIGPASTDPNGPWGIHLPIGSESYGQEVATMLESAARRLAGSKGNAPRLQDEESTFDREVTASWDTGAPRLVPGAARSREFAPARLVAGQQALAPSALPASVARSHGAAPQANPPGQARITPMPRRRPPTDASALVANGARTALGFQSGAGAQSALVRLGLVPAVSVRLARLANNVVPADFQISPLERLVLNLLGDTALHRPNPDVAASEIGAAIGQPDPVTWMDEFIYKLERFSLSLIEPGQPRGSEPSYRLRF